jgi:catabolite regulation protein CreA
MRLGILIVVLVITCLFAWGLGDMAKAAGATEAVRINKFMAINKLGPADYHLETIRLDDPDNPFVSIYVTHIIADFSFADPSNVSIACRLTGEIPIGDDGKQVINKEAIDDIGHFRKSIGSKVMRVARSYDHEKNVLIYNVYTTKLLDGSMKHSMSVVPLGAPLTP